MLAIIALSAPPILPSVSVVIPAYNEERRLPPSLERVVEFLRESPYLPAEVLVVDDGSKDDTAATAEAIAARLSDDRVQVRVLRNPGNRGKGYAVRHGMLEAKRDWALFSDADLSAPIEELDKLAAVMHGGLDGAIGSRAVDRSLIGVRQPWTREWMGRIFNLAVRLGAGLKFSDTQCGFKLLSREASQQVFRLQRMDRFGFDVEMLFIARKLGLRIAEVPVRWNDVEGTKVSLFSGADAFLDILRVRWNDLRGLYR